MERLQRTAALRVSGLPVETGWTRPRQRVRMTENSAKAHACGSARALNSAGSSGWRQLNASPQQLSPGCQLNTLTGQTQCPLQRAIGFQWLGIFHETGR